MANKQNETAVINNGNWNSATPEIPMHYMHVEIEWLEKALGTSPNDKDLLDTYISSKAPDFSSKEEEIAAIGFDAYKDKQILIYPKGKFLKDKNTGRFVDVHDKRIIIKDNTWFDDKGSYKGEGETVYNIPYYYNYQIRGFFKDSCGLLSRAEDIDENGKKKGNTESSKLKAYKKVIDGCIFVFPRRIAIEIPEYSLDDNGVTKVSSYNENGELKTFSRVLRIQGPTGERTAIATSEVIPAGSRIRFTIGMSSLKFKPAVIEWLNYAMVHGIS